MKSFKELFNSLDAPSAQARREILTGNMSTLVQSGIDCNSCEGICCSFIANSMKTTPLETIDILVFLEEQNRVDQTLIEHLKETIKHYRLDYDIDTGRGTSVRRTYSCPFYSPGAKGCSISRHSKPYGCLGFNAFKQQSSEGESCAPDFELLEQREKHHAIPEKMANQLLKEQLKLNWDKLPMPVALLNMIQLLTR